MKLLFHFLLAFVFTASVFAQTKNNVNTSNIEKRDREGREKGLIIAGSNEYDIQKQNGKLSNYKVVTHFTQTKNHTLSINNSARTNSTTPCDFPNVSGTPAFSSPGSSSVNDDESSTFALPFNFCFYGQSYNSINVFENGNVQFNTNSTAYTSTGFPSNSVNMIAPFWADGAGDLTKGGLRYGKVLVDIYPTKVIISWDSLPYYQGLSASSYTNVTLLNSFQLVLTDGNDPILPPGKNVGFYYRNMKWTTGNASSGVGGFPGTQPGNPATVGANEGNGVDFFQLGRFGIPGSVYDGPNGNNDGVSWLNGKKFFFNLCPAAGTNFEPVSTILGYCDTVRVCGNDTVFIQNSYLGPEANQTVSITATAPTLGSSFSYSTVVNPNGGTSIFMIVDGNTATGGYHDVTITATDNGIPALTNGQHLTVFVDQGSLNNLNGSIVVTPTTGACPGGVVTASVTVNGGVPDNYLWNNNAVTSSTSYTTIIPADSLIFVTLTSNQCKKTITGHININPVPVASISGNLSYCNGNIANTVLTATNTMNPSSQGPHTYTWATSTGTLGSINSATTTATKGVYTVTVTNQFGCKSTATTTVTANETPNYNITSASNSTVFCLNQDTARLGINFGISASGAPCGLGNSGCLTTNTFAVGTGTTNVTTSNVTPFVSFWESSRHQYLYKASELLSAGVQPGKLTSIAFNLGTVSTETLYPNFKVQIKCTSANDVGTSFDNIGLSQVYLSNTPIQTGWNVLNFNQSYIWDGTSNILIDICHGLTSGIPSNSQVKCTTTSFTSVIGDSDSGSGSLCGANGTPSTDNRRPNAKFGNCLAQQSGSQFSVAITPSVGVSIPASNDSIRIALPGTVSTNCYTVSIINVAGNCVKDTVICLSQTQGVTQTSLVVSSSSICAGNSVTLSNANSVSTYTILYNNGTGIQSSINAPITFTPSASVSNTYTLIAQGFCGAPIASFTNSISVLPQATLSVAPISNITKCLTNTVTLTANVSSNTTGNSGAPYSYNWTILPGNTPAPGNNSSSSYTTSTTSTNSFVVTVSGFCATTTSASVIVDNFSNNLQVSIIDSAAACPTSNFGLTALVTGGRPNPTFSWFVLPNTSAVSNSNPSSISAPEAQGIYTVSVLVTDSCGYTAADAQVITVLPPCEIVIPNIITPNGDGTNDVFKITNIEFHPNSILTVYDRWGRKVYENQNYQNDWKGSGISDGTYFYVIDVPNDKKYNGFITVFTGK